MCSANWMKRSTATTLALTALVALGATLPASAAAAFRTGLDGLPTATPGADVASWDVLTRRTGATVMREQVEWALTAPTKPADETNPDDPAYRWTSVDAHVRRAAAIGGEALLNIFRAPTWAEGPNRPTTGFGPCRRGDVAGTTPPCRGSWKPDAAAFGRFARAVAKRYDGNTPDPLNPGAKLPRVRMYEVWNESNYKMYLSPQCSKGIIASKNNTCSQGGTITVIELYRSLLNSFFDGVKAIQPDAVIGVGGLAPYSWSSQGYELDPQVFMRGLMCLGGKASAPVALPASKCPVKAKFDAFAFHPYNPMGTPNAKAYSPDGAAIGNTPDLKRAIDTAVAKQTILPAGRKEFWATEFAWATCPPCRATSDPAKPIGYPQEKAAAYTAETMYRLWSGGVSMTVWWGMVDGSVDDGTSGTSRWPSGLYSWGDTPETALPKLSLKAFRFPIFSAKSGAKAFAWTVSPCRAPGTVVTIQAQSGKTGRFTTVASRSLPSGSDGVVKTPAWAIPAFTRWIRATVSGPGCTTESSLMTTIAAK